MGLHVAFWGQMTPIVCSLMHVKGFKQRVKQCPPASPTARHPHPHNHLQSRQNI